MKGTEQNRQHVIPGIRREPGIALCVAGLERGFRLMTWNPVLSGPNASRGINPPDFGVSSVER